MANIVTFDPIELRIIEIDTGGNNVIDIVEIYSEWKDWILADLSRLGYPQAFDEVGGNPISQTRSLGVTFFLLNGWKIRPAERDHQLVINGNLFTVPAGQRRTVPTLGDYTVEIEWSTSNLIDTVATGGTEAPTAAQVADAILNEQVDEHLTDGSTGKIIKDISKIVKTNLALNL